MNTASNEAELQLLPSLSVCQERKRNQPHQGQVHLSGSVSGGQGRKGVLTPKGPSLCLSRERGPTMSWEESSTVKPLETSSISHTVKTMKYDVDS